MADAVTVPVIASGGVGTLEHLVEGIRDGHATAVLAASIFHFGEHTGGRRFGLEGRSSLNPAIGFLAVSRANRCRSGVSLASLRTPG